MENFEFSGKTVSDAITAASVALGITSDQLAYEVIEKGSTGILGFGSKDAMIRVTKKSDIEKKLQSEEKEKQKKKKKQKTVFASSSSQENVPSDDSCTESAQEFLKGVFDAMNLEVEIEAKLYADDNILDIDLKGPEMGIIIGKRGQTLDSLQYLTNLAVNRKIETYTKIKIDTEDYRKRRKETLENLAKNVAYKVKNTNKPVSLEAMNPFERRIIHFTLQNDNHVSTHSEGEEPYRHIVVTPKKN